MVLKIQWTKRAAQSFDKIVNYIEEHWSLTSARNFVQKTNNLIAQIAENPDMCQHIEGKDLKKGVISYQTALYYRVKNDAIHLITFWDNRRDPKSLKL